MLRDASHIVALLVVLFLVLAALAWWRIYRRPAEKPPTEKDSKRANSAAMFIVIAFALSVIAAGIAVFGWF
jgi:uncharacterized iron-regulated membrane protein